MKKTAWIYPFNTWYLQTQLTREELAQALQSDCFLSDEGYRSDRKDQSFYGRISAFDFQLETIRNKETLAPFAHGEFRGVERDTYVVLRCGAFQHRRIWAIAIAFLGLLLVASLSAPAGNVQHALGIVCAAFAGLLIWRGLDYQKRLQSNLQHFLNLFKASTIQREQVPEVLFR
jgi:hypothetical protein